MKTRDHSWNPWPWALFGIPALTILAGVITIVLAVGSEDGLVMDDYYKQGLAINKTLERQDVARKLSVRADIRFINGSVVVLLSGGEGFSSPPSIQLHWMHPTQAGSDRTMLMHRGPEGYTASAPSLTAGRWNVSLEDETKAWRLVGSASIPASSTITLLP